MGYPLDQVGFEREYGGQLCVQQLPRVATVSRMENLAARRPQVHACFVARAGRGAQAPSAGLPLIATTMLGETPHLLPILAGVNGAEERPRVDATPKGS